MRCIMRVVSFLGPNVAPVAAAFVQMLSKVVLTVCRNPRNPAFSHFLFEALAGVIRHSLPAQPSLAEPIEATLFPPINHILQQDVQASVGFFHAMYASLHTIHASARSTNTPTAFALVRMTELYRSTPPHPYAAHCAPHQSSHPAPHLQEYLPYAFQVVALLLELRPSPAPAAYMQLLPPLLTPQIWENQGNIPALVRLLR